MSIWFKNYKIEDFKDSSINIDAHLGIEFLEIGRDFFKAKMPVDKRTKQPLGLLHGGASCVLAESTASFAAFLTIDPRKKNSSRTQFKCKSYQNHYLRICICLRKATSYW